MESLFSRGLGVTRQGHYLMTLRTLISDIHTVHAILKRVMLPLRHSFRLPMDGGITAV
jgi:hypothetical protein